MTSVLVADDDNNLRGTLETLLKTAGFEVTGAANGEQALAAIDSRQASGQAFDIIVLDLLLPKVAGLDVAQRLKAGGMKSALIFVSGVFKSAQHVHDAQEKFKPKAFLIKPFDNDDLLKLCMDVDTQSAKAADVSAAVVRQPMPPEGGLLENPVLHLLWRAARESHTGILDVFGQGRRGRVFVYRGRATMAQASHPQINIAVELIRMGILTAEMFQQALALVAERQRGLYDVIKAEGWARDQDFKDGYKKLIPKAVGYIIAASGSFRWTDTDKFSKLVPAAPLDLLGTVKTALRSATSEELAPHVEPRQVLRLAPGDNWDEIAAIADDACGSSSLLRAINGRATIAQMLSAARTEDDRAARLRQAYLLMSTQAVIASTEVIKMERKLDLEPEHRSPPPQSAAAPPAASAPRSAPAGAMRTGPTEADDDIDFTPEEQEARTRIFGKLKSAKGKNHYEVLGLAAGSDDATIKKAYYALARDYHPDSFSGLRLGSAQEALDQLYAIIQAAQSTLSDAKKRAEFDAGLQMEEQGMVTDIGALFEAERHFTKAKNLVDRGDMVAAIKLLELAHEANPGNGEWKATLAYARWWQNRNASDAGGAISIIEAVSREMEGLADLPYYAGNIALESGDLKRANKLLKKCLTINETHTMAQRALRSLNKKLDDANKPQGIGRFLKR